MFQVKYSLGNQPGCLAYSFQLNMFNINNGELSIDYIRISAYKHAMRKTASLFKALSDETRLRITAILAHGELCVCDLMEVLGLPQSTVSRHLATLRHAELVEDRRQGVWSYYQLRESPEPVYGEMLRILSENMGHIKQAQADLENLQALQLRKKPDSCR